MNLNCKICELENPEPSHFWKEHKIKESDYYLKYYPKKDLLTQEILLFKDRDSYLLNNFANKHNLKKYFNNLSRLESKMEFLKGLLLKRKEIKGWIYTPTQVELRSCPEMVGISTFNNTFGDYYWLCEHRPEMGFKSRGFKNINESTILKSARDIKTILVDSREQHLIEFKDMEISTLPYGDYTVKDNNFGIYIERKSIQDFVGTMLPTNLDRFARELERAKQNGDYIILLVESPFNTCLNFEYNTRIPRFSQATSAFIFHNVRELLQKYDNWQIAFCDGRKDMKSKIIKIFEMQDYWKSADLQLGLDLKLFNNEI